ncbi:MAG: fatty acid desaturase [Gammaproteobacteria bacterium]|nr:fatty acid desaturase [Gammaproteobacteria bacterium]
MSQDTATDSGMGSPQPDLKRYIEPSILNALPHYIPLGIFPLIFLALIYGGWWLIPPFLFMSVAGPADKWLGPDGQNINPKTTPERRLIWHNLPLWGWAFLWPPTLIFGMWQILVANPFAIWEEVILVFILTMEAQAVFMVGHELVHRRTTWERRIAEFLLASGSYPQYATEHVYIHHAQVGTPNDVGSAPKGESFWRYFPKEVASNLTNSWKTARARLARSNHPIWHYSNPFWRYGLGLLFWYGVTFWMGGIWAVLVFIFLGFCCVFSMKIINYCQHYGLRRVRLPNGRWEKVMPRHSWDADWKFSNWMFFKMQRHSDHHAMASRHYPLLQVRGADESPQLPGTYSDMMNLVVRPKRWFEKMDPLVDQWRKHFYPEIEDWRAYDSPLAASRPESFDSIIEIFGCAPRVAKWIERNPELLDNLHDREFTDLDIPKGFGPDLEYETTARRGLTRLYWTHELGVQEMLDQIAELPAADARDTVDVVRNWSNDKAFQVGIHVIRGNLSPLEASVALSNLAEAVITSVLTSVVADFVERNGTIDAGGLVAMLVGDLASREAYPGVPLDLVFIHDNDQSGSLERLTKLFRTNLENLASDSLVFSPTPSKGNLNKSFTIAEFRTYCKIPESGDEDYLVGSRCIYDVGDSEIRQKLDDIRSDILAEIRADESFLENLSAKIKEGTAVHQSLSTYVCEGLDLVEGAARTFRLKNEIENTSVLVPTAHAIFEKLNIEKAAQAADLMRSLQGVQRLVIEEETNLDEAGQKVKSLVASACGYENIDTLTTAVQDSTSQVKRALASLI